MKKIRLIESIVILVMVLALLTTGIFAWIIARFGSEPIIFTSGSIKMEAAFYQANDANLDGILDGGYTQITTGGLQLNDLMPGQTYTFRLVIVNMGTHAGSLSLNMNDIVPSNIALYNLLAIEYTMPGTTNQVTMNLDDSSKIFFTDYVLDFENTLTFDFVIMVKPTINNSLQGGSISIGHLFIRLDQIIEAS